MFNKVGEVTIRDGAVQSRSSINGSLIVGEGQGKYYEAASRGHVFSLVLNAWTTTINAGNIVGAAAAAATQFAVWNPTGSGKNLALLKFTVNPISGTPPVAGLWHSYSSTAPTIASSALNAVACNNVGMAASCVAGYLSSAAGSNLTGSTALKYICAANFYVQAGTFASLAGVMYVDNIDGMIVIPPGTGWVPTWSAAGTTFLGGYSVTWAELDI